MSTATGTDPDTEARLTRLEQLVEDLEATRALDPDGETADADGPAPAGATLYGDVEEWVVAHFTPMYGRPLGGQWRWCARWWDHAEAISRLRALWSAWEDARVGDNAAMLAWYRDLDHQLPILMGQHGPFARCSTRHEPGPALPTEPAPDGYWTGGLGS